MALSYKTQISKADNHDALKAVGAKMYEAELKPEQRNARVSEYREKRKELDRKLAGDSANAHFKQMLFGINVAAKKGLDGIRAAGKALYSLCNQKDAEGKPVISDHERSLLWRAFYHQKNKAVAGSGEPRTGIC